MKRRGLLMMCAAMGLLGCGGPTGNGDGAATGGDMSGGGGGGDMTGVDMTGVDMALGPKQIEVNWNLKSANISGGTNNGYDVDCDKAGATQLLFTVTNPSMGAPVTTMAPCPSGFHNGTAKIATPDLTGPFTVTGTIVDKPLSVGEKVKQVQPGSNPTIRIYAAGCDQTGC